MQHYPLSATPCAVHGGPAPTPTLASSSLPAPSGTISSWPTPHLPSVAPLPTPTPSLTSTAKQAILDDAFTLASTLGWVSTRFGHAQVCLERLRGNLGMLGDTLSNTHDLDGILSVIDEATDGGAQ